MMGKLSEKMAWAIENCVDSWSELEEEAIKKGIDRLAYYEDLEEQGRMAILPCALEADIFRVTKSGVYGDWQVAYAEVYSDGIVMIDDSDNHFEADDIGKTVFLSREEAEKALRG